MISGKLSQLEQCHSLLLLDSFEPADNALTLVLGATSLGVLEDVEVVPGTTIRSIRAITHAENDGIFHLTWDSYVAYAVTNESFAVPDDAADREGRLLVRFQSSNFGNYVRSMTWADTHAGDRGGVHWEVNCENHCIDVFSVDEPRLEYKNDKKKHM